MHNTFIYTYNYTQTLGYVYEYKNNLTSTNVFNFSPVIAGIVVVFAPGGKSSDSKLPGWTTVKWFVILSVIFKKKSSFICLKINILFQIYCKYFVFFPNSFAKDVTLKSFKNLAFNVSIFIK